MSWKDAIRSLLKAERRLAICGGEEKSESPCRPNAHAAPFSAESLQPSSPSTPARSRRPPGARPRGPRPEGSRRWKRARGRRASCRSPPMPTEMWDWREDSGAAAAPRAGRGARRRPRQRPRQAALPALAWHARRQRHGRRRSADPGRGRAGGRFDYRARRSTPASSAIAPRFSGRRRSSAAAA